MGHLPVVEIISDENEECLLTVSAALMEELFALHRQATYIASTSGVIEDALKGDWPSSPSTAPPAGAGKWPPCPQEVDTSSGETFSLIIYLIRVAPGVTPSLKVVYDPKYSEIGGYTPSSFERLNLPSNVIPLLVSNSNASLAV